jgi:D-alanyl-D-alanine carboxypeptidase/D-alanyl-D-alanine-endopeptidase (penicillin-binding protein 4)
VAAAPPPLATPRDTRRELREVEDAPHTLVVPRPDAQPGTTPRRRGRHVALLVGVVAVVAVLATVAGFVFTGATGSLAIRLATGPRIDRAAPVLAADTSHAPIPTPAGLAAALAKPLKDVRLGGHVSFAVTDVATGQLLYGMGQYSPATPASTMKLATATALLALRGPDFRITTHVVAGSTPGEVVIVGAGDPTLGATTKPTYPGSARLDVLADEVRRALGDVAPTKVVIDDTLFQGSPIGPNWLPEDVNGKFVTRIYPLSTDAGRIDPQNLGAAKRYPNSATATGQIFAGMLGLPTSAVSFGTAPATPDNPASPTSPGAVLGSVQSAPVVRIIETMLENSDNVLAEFMARQVAIAVGEPPSFAGAAKAVTDELHKLGLPIANVHIVDGSGLSTDNRLTAALLTSIMSYAAQPAHRQMHALLTGLPVAGYSGTLQSRFHARNTSGADGLLRAKTGTLTGVSALAGIVIDKSGRPLAFALILDATGGQDAPAAADVVGATLRNCGCTG